MINSADLFRVRAVGCAQWFRDETERLMVLGSAGKDVADFLRIHYPDEALGILTYAADGGRTSLRMEARVLGMLTWSRPFTS